MARIEVPWEHEVVPSTIQVSQPTTCPRVFISTLFIVDPTKTPSQRETSCGLYLQLFDHWLVFIDPSGHSVVDSVKLEPALQSQLVNQTSGHNQSAESSQKLIKLSKKGFQGYSMTLKASFTETFERWSSFLRHLQRQYVTQVGFQGRFKPTRKLGNGATATVFEGIEAGTEDVVAIKAFKKSAYFARQGGKGQLAFHKQWQVLSKCQHEGVCAFRGTFETGNSIYMILEKYDRPLGGLLNGEDLPVAMVLQLMWQLLQALSYIHAAGIMHRDIKLENIMLQRRKFDYKPVLIDFGMAEYTSAEEYLFPKCGTPGYVAPQVFEGGMRKQPQKCDVFSLGVVFYILLLKKHLFQGSNAKEAVINNRKGNRAIDFDGLHKKGSQVKDLVLKMIEVDPQMRISAAQALEHEVFKPALSPAVTTISSVPVLGTSCFERIDFEEQQREERGQQF